VTERLPENELGADGLFQSVGAGALKMPDHTEPYEDMGDGLYD